MSALDKRKWQDLRPKYFILQKTAPATHWLGGWVGLRAHLDTTEKTKISAPPLASHHPANHLDIILTDFTDYHQREFIWCK